MPNLARILRKYVWVELESARRAYEEALSNFRIAVDAIPADPEHHGKVLRADLARRRAHKRYMAAISVYAQCLRKDRESVTPLAPLYSNANDGNGWPGEKAIQFLPSRN